MYKKIFPIILILSYLNNKAANSQDLYSQSINDQFKTVIDGSNNFQEYKVIKQTQVNALWKNTIDSLIKKEKALQKTSQELNNLKASISNKEKALLKKEENLKTVLNNANSISFLGIVSLTKSNYKIIMWSIIILLLGISAFLFYQAKSAKSEAKYRIKLFEEITEDFKNFKMKSNENEKKLARQLQDERNKLAEHNIR